MKLYYIGDHNLLIQSFHKVSKERFKSNVKRHNTSQSNVQSDELNRQWMVKEEEIKKGSVSIQQPQVRRSSKVRKPVDHYIIEEFSHTTIT